jgi:hypothetical protein
MQKDFPGSLWGKPTAPVTGCHKTDANHAMQTTDTSSVNMFFDDEAFSKIVLGGNFFEAAGISTTFAPPPVCRDDSVGAAHEPKAALLVEAWTDHPNQASGDAPVAQRLATLGGGSGVGDRTEPGASPPPAQFSSRVLYATALLAVGMGIAIGSVGARMMQQGGRARGHVAREQDWSATSKAGVTPTFGGAPLLAPEAESQEAYVAFESLKRLTEGQTR